MDGQEGPGLEFCSIGYMEASRVCGRCNTTRFVFQKDHLIAAVNAGVYASSQTMIFSGYLLRGGTAVSYGSPAAAAAAKLLQSCPTLCNPIDGSPPGSAVPGILQARTLERIAISFSRVSSQPRDRTQVSCIAGRFFTI